jgi:hypothetical protein
MRAIAVALATRRGCVLGKPHVALMSLRQVQGCSEHQTAHLHCVLLTVAGLFDGWLAILAARVRRLEGSARA